MVFPSSNTKDSEALAIELFTLKYNYPTSSYSQSKKTAAPENYFPRLNLAVPSECMAAMIYLVIPFIHILLMIKGCRTPETHSISWWSTTQMLVEFAF